MGQVGTSFSGETIKKMHENRRANPAERQYKSFAVIAEEGVMKVKKAKTKNEHPNQNVWGTLLLTSPVSVADLILVC